MFGIFGLFENFNIVSFTIVITSIIINLFAFINLIEKYDKAILFLNLGLFLFITIDGYYVLVNFLSKGFYIVSYIHFKFLILLIVILIIVNIFKIKNNKEVEEIDNIGKHND